MRKLVVTAEAERGVRSDRRFRAALNASPSPRGWREKGLCTRQDPDLFFPQEPADLEPARSVCRACPVTGACLAEALNRAEIDGVWGGTTNAERRIMRVVWRRVNAARGRGAVLQA